MVPGSQQKVRPVPCKKDSKDPRGYHDKASYDPMYGLNDKRVWPGVEDRDSRASPEGTKGKDRELWSGHRTLSNKKDREDMKYYVESRKSN